MKVFRMLLLVLAATFSVPASAQEWPARPVRIVNTFAPGGAADILARIVADHLSHAFRQQFFVVKDKQFWNQAEGHIET